GDVHPARRILPALGAGAAARRDRGPFPAPDRAAAANFGFIATVATIERNRLGAAAFANAAGIHSGRAARAILTGRFGVLELPPRDAAKTRCRALQRSRHVAGRRPGETILWLPSRLRRARILSGQRSAWEMARHHFFLAD